MGGIDKLMERLQATASTSRKSGTRAATSGSAPAARRRSAMAAITRRACASAATRRGQSRRRSRSGKRAPIDDYDDQVGARHAQHQGGAAPLAPLRARRRGRRARPAPTRSARTAANAGWLDIKMRARAPQQGEGADAARRRRLDGRSHQAHRGAVLGREDRVQAPRVLLLPQLRVRLSVEEQPPPSRRDAPPTWDVLHKYTSDYKLIFVGDATMSPYESAAAGRLRRIQQHRGRRRVAAPPRRSFPHHAWLNPEPEGLWAYRQSVSTIRDVLGHRMYPLTLAGPRSPRCAC